MSVHYWRYGTTLIPTCFFPPQLTPGRPTVQIRTRYQTTLTSLPNARRRVRITSTHRREAIAVTVYN